MFKVPFIKCVGEEYQLIKCVGEEYQVVKGEGNIKAVGKNISLKKR